MDEVIQHISDEFASANPQAITDYVLLSLMNKINEAIPDGEENAITRQQLKEKIGYRNDRKLRDIIKQMRDSGKFLIIATEKGYWKPKTSQDVESWANYMRSYIQDISHTVKIVEETAKIEFAKRYDKGYQVKMDLNS